MKIHLYEFRAGKNKLTCLCGWERTLKTSDPKTVRKTFTEHCLQEAPPKPS